MCIVPWNALLCWEQTLFSGPGVCQAAICWIPFRWLVSSPQSTQLISTSSGLTPWSPFLIIFILICKLYPPWWYRTLSSVFGTLSDDTGLSFQESHNGKLLWAGWTPPPNSQCFASFLVSNVLKFFLYLFCLDSFLMLWLGHFFVD